MCKNRAAWTAADWGGHRAFPVICAVWLVPADLDCDDPNRTGAFDFEIISETYPCPAPRIDIPEHTRS